MLNFYDRDPRLEQWAEVIVDSLVQMFPLVNELRSPAKFLRSR